METRTIRVYKPCEQCKGTGLLKVEGRTLDCHICQSYGEVLEIERRDVPVDEFELPTRGQ